MHQLSRHAIGLAIFLLCSQAMATDLYVSDSGNDSGNCQNSSQPCKNISYAVNNSSNGDTIHIAAGAYNEQGPISIAKTISLVGAQAGVDARIRDAGNYNESSIQIVHGFVVSANEVTFDGLELKQSSEFGIKIDPYRQGTLVQNSLFLNHNTSIGMANNGDSALVISRNVFSGSNSGGLIAYSASNDPVKNVVISENLFVNHPVVAIDVEGSGETPMLSNITIENNTIQNSRLGVILQTTKDSRVTGNTFQNTNTGDRVKTAVWIIGSNDKISVTNNLFNGGSYGAYLNQLSGYSNTNISISRNSFSNMSEGGVGAAYAPSPRAGYMTCNWWGDASGPKTATNAEGSGEAVIGDVENTDFDPWLKTSELNGPCGDEPPPEPTPPDSGPSKDFAGTWKSGNKCLVISDDLATAKSYRRVGPLKITKQEGVLMTYGTSLEPTGDYTHGVISYSGAKPHYQELKLEGPNLLQVDEYYGIANNNPLNSYDTSTYRKVKRCGWEPHFPPHPPRPPHPRPEPVPQSIDQELFTIDLEQRGAQ